MVGRLLSFWGKYIFRGYVKLPGGKYIIYMPPFLPRNQLPKLHATWDMAVRDCSWALLLGRVYVSTASISITCITIFKFTLVCFWVPSSSKQSWLSCFHQNFCFIKLPYPLSVIEESARCPGWRGIRNFPWSIPSTDITTVPEWPSRATSSKDHWAALSLNWLWRCSLKAFVAWSFTSNDISRALTCSCNWKHISHLLNLGWVCRYLTS